jgi:hypothetical protein
MAGYQYLEFTWVAHHRDLLLYSKKAPRWCAGGDGDGDGGDGGDDDGDGGGGGGDMMVMMVVVMVVVVMVVVVVDRPCPSNSLRY